MGTTEIVAGTLKGMGFVVECRLMVTASDMRPEAGPAYTRCGVLDAPTYLPDGYYEASFCSHTAFLQKADGGWNLGIPWRDLSSSARSKRAESHFSPRPEFSELP